MIGGEGGGEEVCDRLIEVEAEIPWGWGGDTSCIVSVLGLELSCRKYVIKPLENI